MLDQLEQIIVEERSSAYESNTRIYNLESPESKDKREKVGLTLLIS